MIHRVVEGTQSCQERQTPVAAERDACAMYRQSESARVQATQ